MVAPSYAASGPHEASGNRDTGTDPRPAHPEDASAARGNGGGEPASAVESDLPEELPLTPELVEEDALRNDFVLRLAVVLLACLLGCTELGETETLVHVRGGQYLASHGILPPRSDVFAYTTEGRPWVQLSWLFDLTVAGVYTIGGMFGLSVFKALVAAATFYFVVQTRRDDVSTWWGSICAMLALLVCFPQLTALPELITLFGVAFVWWLLSRWEQGGSRRCLWVLVITFGVWSNLDPRMYVGIVLVLLYAAGEFLGRLFGRNELTDATRRRALWIATAGCVAATLVNPFTWQALAAPLSLYSIEYPGLRNYEPMVASVKGLESYPLASASFWRIFSLLTVARVVTVSGLTLAALALITFVLNRRSVSLTHVLVCLGFAGLAAAGSHELAPAAIVFAVLATLNGQEWYRDSFRQTYSIDFSERLFSNGGRALTALAFFLVAGLAIIGWLMGAEGNRIGLGLRQPLAAEIDGLRLDLADVPAAHHGFNLLPGQGDLLIWIGRRPFIDSRLALYGGSGQDDLVRQHHQAADALALPAGAESGTGDRGRWESVFREHGVDYLLPYLGGQRPRHEEFRRILRDPDEWELTELGSTAGVIYWRNSSDEEARRYAASHIFNVMQAAFEPVETEEVPIRLDWARPPSWYEGTLYRPRVKRTSSLQRARHFDMLFIRDAISGMEQGTPVPYRPEFLVAVAHLAIRHANQALADDPNLAEAHRVLAHAYEFLTLFELQFAPSLEAAPWWRRRYLQTVNAYAQSLLIDPTYAPSWKRLRNLYFRWNRFDLARDAALRYEERLPGMSAGSPDGQKLLIQERRESKRFLEDIDAQIKTVNAHLEQALAGEQVDYSQVAQVAFTNGCVLRGLELLEQVDDEQRVRDPHVRLQEAIMLQEAGHSEQADEILRETAEFFQSPLYDFYWRDMTLMAGLQGQVRIPTVPHAFNWREMAAIAALTGGDYQRAAGLWADDADQLREQQFADAFATFPLASRPPVSAVSELRQPWPVNQLWIAYGGLLVAPERQAASLLNAALANLEVGRVDEADEQLHRILELHPETSLRPILQLYISAITDRQEIIDSLPPSEWIPITPDLFAPDPRAPVAAPRP